MQRLARIDSQVVDERLPRLGVCVKRLRLPVGAVEGQHLLRAESFPQRVLAHEQAQLTEDLFVPAERNVTVDPVHQRRQPELVELGDLVTTARFEQQTRQGRTAPEAERLAQELGSRFQLARGCAFAGAGKQLPQARNVQLIVVDHEAVAAVRRRDRVVTVTSQHLAQLGDVDVDGLLCRGRRRLAPEVVDQALAGDELIRV